MSTSSSPDSAHPVSMPPPTSSNPSPPTNLRHITSNTALPNPTKDGHKERERKVSGRVSQHLQTGGLTAGSARLGSRSPTSIPSSPTSVHSSSSAIFERDIEPITSPSPPHPHHPPNPHRTPRSKTTEQLDQSVPAVLDSAAAILASSQGLDDDRISIVAPVTSLNLNGSTGSRSGVTSPIGSFRSRSPSPTTAHGPDRRTSLLLSLPSPPLQTNVPLGVPQQSSPPGTAKAGNLSIQTSPSSSSAKGVHPNASTPSIVTPTSAYYSMASSGGSSPATTTLEHPPTSLPTSTFQSHSPAFNPTQLPAYNLNVSHPPSPIASTSAAALGTSTADKRLSFMSYSDLLASTPAALQPLSSLTTSATSEPPPHLPSVSGITQSSAQAHSPSHSPGRGGSLLRAAGVIEGRGAGDRNSAVLDDVGGEFEREGFGGGLEERLEALLGVGIPPSGLTPPAKA